MEPASVEQRLLEANEAFDIAIQARDQAAIEALFATDVIVHKDGLTLYTDLKGKSAAIDWVIAYWQLYNYKHESIVGAVSELPHGGESFSFWEDTGVHLKSQDVYPYLPEAARRPSTTTGIWHLLYNSDVKITEVWFLRELSVDEYYRKMQKAPPQALVFDPEGFRGSLPGVTHSTARRMRILNTVDIYGQVWAMANASLCDHCLAPDVVLNQPVLGRVYKGLDKIKDLVQNHYAKNWEPRENVVRLSATGGSTGFIWWCSTGLERQTGMQSTMFGLEVMKVNADEKIERIIGFRQLTRHELDEYVKPEFRQLV